MSPSRWQMVPLPEIMNRETRGASVRGGTKPRAGRRTAALLVAVLMGFMGVVFSSSTAHGAVINPVQENTLKAEKSGWDGMKISGEWKLAAGASHEGDSFNLAIPVGFEGVADITDLTVGGDSFGKCATSKTRVVCILNGKADGTSEVTGKLSFRIKSTAKFTGTSITFNVNGDPPVQVSLPDGQEDIEYDPSLPETISNEGTLTGNPADGVKWQIVVPGGLMTDRDTLKIRDEFRQAGVTYEIDKGAVKLYRFKNTPQCWDEKDSPACSEVIYQNAEGAVPPAGLDIAIDDGADLVNLTYKNDTKFTAGHVYVLEIALKVKEKILSGSLFSSSAYVNESPRYAYAYLEPTEDEPSRVGNITIEKLFGDEQPPNIPTSLSGPQALPNETPADIQIPEDAVFTVRYRYSYEGQERSGVLELKGPQPVTNLYNIPVGSVVTLTEEEAHVDGVKFGDPEFEGDGVVDGVPDARSAQVTVNAAQYFHVRLRNPIATKLATVNVTPGVCAPGAKEPSEPTVTIGASEGITYSQPEITKNGKQVTVKITATPENGREIDDQDLPEGWATNGDGSFTFTRTITQPDCAVVPVVPDVKPGVCPVDSTTPTQPTVSGIEDTDSIDYGEPVFGTNGNEVTVTVTAIPKNGSRIDVAKLPEGWSVVDGVATYSRTITQPKCVVPVVPTVDVGSCPAGATTPTAPSAVFDEVEGLEFSEPRIEVRDGKMTVSAAATAKAGYQIGGPLPEGWTRVNETSATFTTVKDQPACGVSPTPTVPPSATPTPVPTATVTPTPVRPGLPRTGA